MSCVITVKENALPIYDIHIEHNYKSLYKAIEGLNIKNGKACIVSDTNISKHYMSEVVERIKDYVEVVKTYIITPGEEYKNLDTVKGLYEYLIQSKFDRQDILIALGGGVVGDLTGYTAATYLRGIRFIQLPTSLLAMVDSSIGGKTGVDFLAYKNMVGAFHQPKEVYININTLNTLNEEQFSSGLGEVIKYGLIKDPEYYNWLKANADKILNKDVSTLEEMILRSCENKRIVVEKDPTEQGERALLNFGHTIGHSIEKLMNFQLLHGNCVAIGMVAASYISYMRENISETDLNDIIDTLKMFHLPTKVTKLNINEVVDATKNDKKMEAGTIKFILLESIGNAIIDKTVTDQEMQKAIEFIMD